MSMVEWKKLGDVCKVLRGKRLTKSQLSEIEGYPVLHGGATPMGFYTEYNRKANTTVVVNTGNAGCVFFYDKPFWSSDACFSLYPNEELNDKFLYSFVYGCEHILKGKIRAGAMPTIDANAVESLIIPIPSLSEQNRIVGILDTFTASIDNLKQQIEQRRKQYEYYRDQLLDLEGKEGVEMKELIDVLSQPITDGPHETPIFFDSGIPFISADAIVNSKINFERKRGYISEEYNSLCKKKYSPRLHDVYVVKSGSTTGKVAIVTDRRDFNIWSPLAALRINDNNNPFYIFYWLQTKKAQNQVQLKCSKGSQPNLSMRVLEKFIIPVPSLSEQQRIVSILDSFEASIANLEQQLAQRQKQYEYYRNKLLTFE